jgi:hypothetical protein
MTEHHHHHDHATHPHHPPRPWYTRLHKDWRFWVALGLMLAAMLVYVFSVDESFRSGGGVQPQVPAAP